MGQKVIVEEMGENPIIEGGEKQPIQVRQRVVGRASAYTNRPSPRIKTITIILVVLLAILLGILGLMYLFKSQIIAFFNSVFSNA